MLVIWCLRTARWHLQIPHCPHWFLGLPPGPPGAEATSPASAGPRSLARVAWGAGAFGALWRWGARLGDCVRWGQPGLHKKWWAQMSAGTTKCWLPRQHPGSELWKQVCRRAEHHPQLGVGLRMEGEDLSNWWKTIFFWFSFRTDILACPPASEVLPHPQGAVLLLLLLTWVFPEDSSAAWTGEHRRVLLPVWWEQCRESRAIVCFPVKINQIPVSLLLRWNTCPKETSEQSVIRTDWLCAPLSVKLSFLMKSPFC